MAGEWLMFDRRRGRTAIGIVRGGLFTAIFWGSAFRTVYSGFTELTGSLFRDVGHCSQIWKAVLLEVWQELSAPAEINLRRSFLRIITTWSSSLPCPHQHPDSLPHDLLQLLTDQGTSASRPIHHGRHPGAVPRKGPPVIVRLLPPPFQLA